MIKAIGEDEFKRILDEQPIHYAPEHSDNFKPLTMQLMWESRFQIPLQKGDFKEKMLQAYSLWENGNSRENAINTAFKEYLENRE